MSRALCRARALSCSLRVTLRLPSASRPALPGASRVCACSVEVRLTCRAGTTRVQGRSRLTTESRPSDVSQPLSHSERSRTPQRPSPSFDAALGFRWLPRFYAREHCSANRSVSVLTVNSVHCSRRFNASVGIRALQRAFCLRRGLVADRRACFGLPHAHTPVPFINTFTRAGWFVVCAFISNRGVREICFE